MAKHASHPARRGRRRRYGRRTWWFLLVAVMAIYGTFEGGLLIQKLFNENVSDWLTSDIPSMHPAPPPPPPMQSNFN